jgi:hypothetical protein
MINLIFAVYDKNGSIVPGGEPRANQDLWQGFGGPCQDYNDGDPIVVYDHLADRWVFSQFALATTGHQCVAVSTGPDPTGPYYRYQFDLALGTPDYPKLGVWEDAYYLSANEFLVWFQGAIAVAFERDKMLLGQPAQMVKIGPLECGTECFFSLQPSHLEGAAPPAGTPNTYVMAFDDETWGAGTNPDGYRLWEFAVDWANPNSSSFTPLGQVNTTEFDANLCGFDACVPQRDGELLATLSQFTMYRAQFRDFGTHRSIVLNHTVNVGGDRAGIRWTELRNAGGGWLLYQTGTHAPNDGLHRWMGSAAMDGAGNIALGYSVSGPNIYPEIRYASRSAGDSLGTLTGGEVTLHIGTGSQVDSSNRWGDYSAMSVDPADDCTFWYTQEYYENSGSFDFNTRIGSFKLDSCSPPSQICGNDIIEGTEVCDGTDLGNNTCEDLLGCSGGTLVCNATCDGFDTSECSGCLVCDNDGVCEYGEDCNNCASDCVGGTIPSATCGNGICEAGDGEDCLSCPQDCNGKLTGKPSGRFCCGDGTPCSDERCTNGGLICTEKTSTTLSFCCGDSVCEGGENGLNCAIDCGACGLEICSDGSDNDCDGLVDCEDTDCGTDSACSNGCVPTHDKERGPRCSDGIDNDCDGHIDGNDPDCLK